MVGHAILDAAGHVHVLGFCVDNALATIESKMYGEQGSVADHTPQTFQALVISINYRFGIYHSATFVLFEFSGLRIALGNQRVTFENTLKALANSSPAVGA